GGRNTPGDSPPPRPSRRGDAGGEGSGVAETEDAVGAQAPAPRGALSARGGAGGRGGSGPPDADERDGGAAAPPGAGRPGPVDAQARRERKGVLPMAEILAQGRLKPWRLLPLLLLAAGCTTTDGATNKSEPPPAPGVPCQIVTTWHNAVAFTPDP